MILKRLSEAVFFVCVLTFQKTYVPREIISIKSKTHKNRIAEKYIKFRVCEVLLT